MSSPIPSTPPSDEMLRDHRGNLRARADIGLSYGQARLGLAFHEAAHAVVGLSVGTRVLTSEVIAWSPGPGMWTVTGNTAQEWRGAPGWEFATVAAAGEQAHVEYLWRYGLWTPGRAADCAADHDRELAIDTLAEHGLSLGRDSTPPGGRSWAAIQRLARRTVKDLWPAIRTVAFAVDQHTRLTGTDITDLLGPLLRGGAA
ncbi:hypothetical protein [Streptomyces sp. CA-253872]|uniref:hypothetical protein n=1 Tax=Streptomyces sp. CA-253872 TaxID=3240067 RepID=UPI003D904C5B